MRHTEVDYVIVGAGSAGCVVASRLTEDPTVTVALLEAGGRDNRQEIHIPAAFSKLFKGPCDWAYHTAPQPHLNGRSLYWPRGKVLGGSSSMNAMIYTRGNPRDFDEWASLGNPRWRYVDVAPAFGRAERRQAASETARCGPLDVSELRTKNPLSRAFVAGCAELGIGRTGDFNEVPHEGAGFFHVTQRAGKRCSTAAAYLKPARKRRNLMILTDAPATRVVFEGHRAAGVEYRASGRVVQVRAAREVIVSGGAINSPQLLMLSGIGPATELRSHGIAVIADVPAVGRHLQDHLFAAVVHECVQPVSLAAAETLANVVRFLVLRKGMLTSNVAEAGAFVRIHDDAPTPDIELIFGPAYYMNHGFSNPKGHGFTIGAILLHPESRGTIRLKSADPSAAPVIDPNYLDAGGDARLLTEGVALARRVAQTRAFDAFRGAELWPGTDVRTDSDVQAFVRATAETLYHPVGTCRMGAPADAVVDDALRVHGVDALRVVDASVMPAIVTGHPNAAVIMIAERASAFIRDTAGASSGAATA